MGHKFASSTSDEFTENARLVLFQFDVAMESCDVYESVGGSEGFPSSISVVVVVFVFIAVPSPSRTDKAPEENSPYPSYPSSAFPPFPLLLIPSPALLPPLPAR